MDARSMGRSKKNLRRISETVTAYNLQRLADMDKTSPGRVVDKLVRDRMSDMLPPPIEAGASCSTAPTD